MDRHAAQCSRAYLSSRSSRDRLIRCVHGNRQRTIARQPPPLHPRIYISIRSKAPFSPEAERELPGKEMVWNNGLTTATVPRDCPNGFVTTQLPYNINATSALWLRLIGMLAGATSYFCRHALSALTACRLPRLAMYLGQCRGPYNLFAHGIESCELLFSSRSHLDIMWSGENSPW